MSVQNKTRGTMIARHLLTLNSNCYDTLRFLNRAGIPRNCALWIVPCRAIYTVGMKSSVDIAFLNTRGRVVNLFRNLPPDCVANASSQAVSAVELSPDSLTESGTSVGDTLELDPN
jgi:hypothetical protein